MPHAIFVLATRGQGGYQGWITSCYQRGAMNDEGIRQQIELLKIEHRDLDDAITALQANPVSDQLQIARLKRKKLALKDRIGMLEDQLIPDIIA